MTANRRVEYQKLCEQLTSSKTQKSQIRLRAALRELVASDENYAKGFIEDTLNLGLRWLSPTVGKTRDRPFNLIVEIHKDEKGEHFAIIGASFKPKTGDNVKQLSLTLGKELYVLSSMKGFDWLIKDLAVNGHYVEK